MYGVCRRQEYAKDILSSYKNVDEAVLAVQNHEAIKRSNVANGMTLDYRIWELTEEVSMEAEARYREILDRLSSEEFYKYIENGEISVAKFDKSAKYKERIANYVSKDDMVTKAERTALEDASDVMSERVLADTHILFTTASNCGGPLLLGHRSFVPTVIFCDEAGQISIPILCVPLTIFGHWKDVFLFGDIQQLEPTALSGKANEFIANAKMSPLALLAVKGYETMLLDTQYRMCPANSRFPRHQFYDGEGLKDSQLVKEDNDVRQAMRRMTKESGVDGDNKEGSEYVLTNVPNGCSRVEHNGTSLVNHANADVILNMIARFLAEGTIKAKMNKVLSYYQGQRRLIRKKIQAMSKWNQEIKNAIEVATVDTFQGKEARVVIVDIVAAKDKHDFAKTPDNVEDDNEDTGGEDYVKVSTVTGA